MNGVPRRSLRGPITKIGRKILKILVMPIADVVLGKPVLMMVRAVEERQRRDLYPQNYARHLQLFAHIAND